MLTSSGWGAARSLSAAAAVPSRPPAADPTNITVLAARWDPHVDHATTIASEAGLDRVPVGDVALTSAQGLALAPVLTTSTLTPERRVAPGWPFEQHGPSTTAGPVMKVRNEDGYTQLGEYVPPVIVRRLNSRLLLTGTDVLARAVRSQDAS